MRIYIFDRQVLKHCEAKEMILGAPEIMTKRTQIPPSGIAAHGDMNLPWFSGHGERIVL